ncbi:efflux RND transporter permease subunit [Vulcanococcus limneticus]|uniref:efflux RND transporter permease subunit n=1 Tax=Vulcanococcus limneticus TaxID=2170428 RepID=UPI00398C1866
MKLSVALIRRPVTTILLSLALVVFGVVGYLRLPISDLPSIDFPTLQVSASLPGANPQTMATAVATPLEQQFSSIAGLSAMTSSSSQGSTQISLQFNLDREIDVAAQDVQTAISQASRLLPPDMPTAPSLRKVNPAEQPIFYLVLSSEVLPLSEVSRAAEVQMAQRLSMLDGVSQVQVFGAQKYAVRIRVDPQALTAKGIGLDEVAGAIRSGNSNLPTGNLYGRQRTYSVEDNTRLEDAGAYRQLVVAFRNGSPVRLGDVAEVSDSVANERLASWYNGTRSIVLAVQRQPGSNTVAIADAIRALLPELEQQIPGAIQVDVLFDRSESIREAIHDVQINLVVTVALVVAVVALFLGTGIATALPSLAVVVSLVATFGAMAVLGFSLDNISLMALTLSVGFVVDDAIVMVEAIVWRQEQGESRWQAAINGAREIGPTIVSMTLALVAVFIPVLFMGGLLGRLFREFAVTMNLAVTFSALVALSLTPMMAARLLPAPGSERRDNPLLRRFDALFARITRLYDRTLLAALRRPRPVQLISVALLLLCVVLVPLVPKGFIPDQDSGQLTVITQAAEGISFEEMSGLHRRLSAKLQAHPAIAGVNSTIGSGGANASANTGRMFVKLKPRSERAIGAEELSTQLRRTVNGIPGLRAFVRVPAAVNIGVGQTRAKYQFTIQAIDLEALLEQAPAFEQRLRALTELTDVSSDLLPNNPELQLRIDRDRAAALSVDAAALQGALRNAYGENQVSTIYKPDGQYPVIAGVKRGAQSEPADLDRLSIRNGEGKLIPLATIASLEQGSGAASINHTAQLPSVTYSFNLRPGVSLDAATGMIRTLAREALPPGTTGAFQGSARVFEESLAGMGWLILAAVLVIYVVLGILYEDAIHPLTILTSLPSAAVGGLLALLVFGSELNIYSIIGLVLLIGTVKKNGIMMVDAAIANRRDGLDVLEAIHRASLVRFRPIMMTTVAAIVGTIPIALGWGAGAESRRPLGLVVLGGMVLSQLVTLYITPVSYVQAERIATRLGLRGESRQEAAEPAEGPTSAG